MLAKMTKKRQNDVAVAKRKRRQKHNRGAQDSRKRQRQAERLSATRGSTPGPELDYDGGAERGEWWRG